MTVTTAFLSRREHFDRVGSTNDVVRDWLAAGTPEVCLAVAGEQTAGRGRDGRTWQAPPGSGLLFSIGFRPTWLAPNHVWRLPAVVSLAMAEAAETSTSLPSGSIGLKWPNDLVLDDEARFLRHGIHRRGTNKLAGVLGETSGLGTADPRVVVGIGVNTNWPRVDFPPDLAPSMTSLFEATDGSIDNAALLDRFLGALEAGVDELRVGRFDANRWRDRQITTGQLVELQAPDGGVELVNAVGVDADSGALLVGDDRDPRPVFVGEITHVRFPTAGRGV
ncbi:MAG TPA: biotin--[acetyl-CoA-carboxylase] ligase [Candidatus Limnocylindrales bacterium]